MGGEGFDSSSVEPSTGDEFAVMPPHWNSFEIEKEEIRETKKVGEKGHKGQYLHLQLSVIGDTFKNHKVFSNITLANDNEKAVEIGRRDLASLALACGIKVLRDSAEFLGKHVDARVTIKPAKGDFKEDNEISAYAPVGTKIGTEVKAKAPSGAKPAETKKAWDKPADAAPAPETKQTVPASGAKKLPWQK
jgi:hypothetical protein